MPKIDLIDDGVVLGIHASHNASACVVGAVGDIRFAAAEERFSRHKGDTGFPHRVLGYIAASVLPPESVRTIAVGERCRASFVSRRFARTFYLAGKAEKDALFRHPLGLLGLLLPELLGAGLGREKNYRFLLRQELQRRFANARIFFLDHHLSHAASAYYCSPFDKALVLTLDGAGDDSSGLVALGAGHLLREQLRLPFGSSVGHFYKSVVSLLGFMPGQHEGKITGLAALGDPERFYSNFSRFLKMETRPDGTVTIRSALAERMASGYQLSDLRIGHMLTHHLRDYRQSRTEGWDEFRRRGLRALYRNVYRTLGGLDIDRLSTPGDRADLAAGAQAVLEDVVLEFVRHQLKQTGSRNLALAGGVFANVRLNQKILEESGAQNVFVQPAMGDEGLALGAAKFVAHRRGLLGPVPLGSVYLGARFTGLAAELEASPVRARRFAPGALADRVVSALLQGRAVGLLCSAAEFGPRALGNRTILAAADRPDMSERLNQRLRRSDFMPFAPVVAAEDFARIFESAPETSGRLLSRFMTVTHTVRPEWRGKISAAVHVDGTARPQVVEAGDNPFLHEILTRYRDRTGFGLLINTSFNLHEEPIVNSPADGIRAFLEGAVDNLVLDEFWCEPPADAVALVRSPAAEARWS